MKDFFKLSLVAATAAIVVTGSALADDPQMQNRQAVQRQAQDSRTNQKTTTVAVYGNGRGLGRAATSEERTDGRFEVRTDAHGHQMGIYVPFK